jgi:hypothetical protein
MAIVSICVSFLVFSAVADTRGVYLCTSDMDSMDSIGLDANKMSKVFNFSRKLGNEFEKGLPDKPVEWRSRGKYIEVYEEDSFRHKHFRHCSVLLGIKTNESANLSKNVIGLTIEQVRGYSGGDIIQDEMWWLEDPKERNKYVVSCTPVLEEGVYSYRSFPYIFKKTYTVNTTNVAKAWVEILYAMGQEASNGKPYSLLGKNCCSVAHNGLKTAKKVLQKDRIYLDLEKIEENARSYNFLGCGITLDFTNIFNEPYRLVKGTSRTCLDILSAPVKVLIRKFTVARGKRIYNNGETDL